jgi:hypothetical protein
MELVADLERVYARKKAANKELVELVGQTGTACSPCTASARLATRQRVFDRSGPSAHGLGQEYLPE